MARGIELSKYGFKVDDLLLRLLNSYHKVDVSDAMAFFGERAAEMLESEPNVTEKSRRPMTVFMGNTTTNITQSGSLRKMDVDGCRVYVLRGFYPETHIPFKMTLVKFDGYDTARGKITIGLKDHHTYIEEKAVKEYVDAMSEAILLDKDVDEADKVEYKYKQFKCMRPKGMELYHERK